MPIPPDEIPEGLSEREYEKLGLLYSFMERHDEAMQANKLAAEAAAVRKSLGYSNTSLDPKASEDAFPPADLDPEKSLEVQQRIAGHIMGMIASLQNSDHTSFDEILKSISSDFESIGADPGQIELLGQQLRGQFEQLSKLQATPPSKDVPEGLSAKEYYDLGVHYKGLGWTEQSRDALLLSIELDGTGKWGEKSKTFLQSKLPHHPVPHVAVERNIEGFNFMVGGQTNEAYSIFWDLIKNYPDFEWPYGNMGSMCIHDGKLKEAVDLLEKALKINPNYVNAWYHLCRARILLSDFPGAHNCLNEVERIDPEDVLLPGMRQDLSKLEE